MRPRSQLLALLLICLTATGCAATVSVTRLEASSESATEPVAVEAPATRVPEVDRDEAVAALSEQAFLTFDDASCVVDGAFAATGTYNVADPAVDTGVLIDSCTAVEEQTRSAPTIRVVETTPGGSDTPITSELKVLFVGNSYTTYNNLPATVDLITRSHGVDLDRTTEANGGYFLSDHVSDGQVEAALATGDYDIVVLQEQSVAPSLIPEMYELTMPFAKTLDAAADQAGVRVIWYQTWGRENGMADLGFGDYSSMQQSLIQGYGEIAAATGGEIAAVGELWQNVRASAPELDLYTDDGSHPTKIGSYVAALELAETILQAPLTVAPPTSGVDAETAAAILALG